MYPASVTALTLMRVAALEASGLTLLMNLDPGIGYPNHSRWSGIFISNIRRHCRPLRLLGTGGSSSHSTICRVGLNNSRSKDDQILRCGSEWQVARARQNHGRSLARRYPPNIRIRSFAPFPVDIWRIIFCICLNWLSSWLTSWAVVPLPRAMRLRRLPPIMSGRWRS